MQIQPQYLTMGTLLSGRLFKVPEYQRAYSWQTKQRADLFHDIGQVLTDGDSMHFLATIVGLRRKKKRIASDELQEIEVVDGQQRLTTLTILLKALSKKMRGTDDHHASEIDSLLVKGDDLSLLLLQTNHDLTHLFVDYLRDGTVPKGKILHTSADQNIVDAIRECEAFVAEWSTSNKTLVDLYAILKNRLSAIFFEIEDEGIVYTVFEVLNSRGLDVTWFDRLKSLLMAVVFESGNKGTRVDTVQELHKLWTEIYRAIGLRWQSLNKETVRFAGTLRSPATPNRPLSEEDAVQTLTRLCGNSSQKVVECSKWVLKVTQAETQLLNNHRLAAVSRIVQARLLAVAILLRGFEQSDEDAILRNWENVTFRIYGLGRFDARTKVGDYVRLAWRVINEKLTPEVLMKEITQLGKGEEFSIRTVVKRLYNTNSYTWSEELRYFLYRYEEFLAEKAGQKINEGMWNRIWAAEPSKSIEHIYPQSRGSDDPATGGVFVQRLGNLVMLPPGVNSALQDDTPKQKAEMYMKQGLVQAIEVAKLIAGHKWNRDTIQKREKRLIRWATTEWGG